LTSLGKSIQCASLFRNGSTGIADRKVTGRYKNTVHYGCVAFMPGRVQLEREGADVVNRISLPVGIKIQCIMGV
jgi:hypothetical protein